MSEAIRKDVKDVIEEIDTAYHEFSNHHNMNADYPDFARMAVGQFRTALRDPSLTREDLEGLLRQGMSKYKSICPDSNYCAIEPSWTNFVASYMAKTANIN